jgi:hypothetical protein
MKVLSADNALDSVCTRTYDASQKHRVYAR